MARLTLSLVIHNHQPVGNFDSVFARATEWAYEPMLMALERYPQVRLGMYYGGPLLDWWAKNCPELLERIRALVQREQVEMLTGAYYDPILPAIPEPDRQGQMEKMTRLLRDKFGAAPTGAWLAEQIWEPHLSRPLSEAGIRYTILDDTPFKLIGLHEDDLFGPYVTEEQGHTLEVFGNSTYLRHSVLWQPVDEVIDWLAQQAERFSDGVLTLADSGEKFGLWPGTRKRCWGEEGWMYRFFSALENADWLEIRPPGEVVAERAPLKCLYLPCASYGEMMEWALSPDDAAGFTDVRLDLEERGLLRFVRGGNWRAFMSRYDEINQLHKKMLWVSRKVHRMPDSEAKAEALDHVWAAQCNSIYWHGLFGGIYLFHLRSASYRHLLAAEATADHAASQGEHWTWLTRTDFDADGREDVIFNTDQHVFIFKPSYGGALVEWDWRSRQYNLLNTMSRRRESYHQRLRKAAEEGRLVLSDQETIFNGVRVREADVHTRLFYDWYRRASLLDHFLHSNITPEAFYQARYGEQGDFVNQPYQAQIEREEDTLCLALSRTGTVWVGEIPVTVRVEKRITAERESAPLKISYRVTNLDDIPATFRFGVEFNWGIIGGHSEHGYLKVGEAHNALDDFEGYDDISELTVGSTLPELAGGITMEFDRPTQLWCFPLETISDSESGYERVYQGTCTLLWWETILEPTRPWEVRFEIATIESSQY